MHKRFSGIGQLKYELECLEEMLDELKKTVSEGGKDPITLSASAEKEDERQAYKSARQILQKFKEKQSEADHAFNLLDQLYKQSFAVNVDQVKDQTDKKAKEKPLKRGKGNEETQDKTKREIDVVSSHEEKYKSISLALAKMEKAKKEAEYAARLLIELKNFATTDKDGPVRNILTEPPQLSSRGEDHEGNGTNANQSKKLVGGNPSSVQLNQNYEIASAVVNKYIEAQYAARLLDELSNFSQTTIEGEDRKILSDPPVRTEEGTTIAETSKTVSQQIQHNQRSSTHFEKASAILNQIKEKQKLIIEKNHVEDELKNLQATIDLYVSDIKISERKNLGLQQDTEKGNKQSEERLKKLQRLSMEYSELTKEINNLRTRLSEIAGAKLTHENPSITDLSDPNRPTKLAEKYSEIYDNQWTDAFSTLSKLKEGASEEDLTGHLYNILVDGYRFCASVRMRQKKNIEVIILHPDANVESIQVSQTEKVNEIFSKLVNDAAKISSNMTSINMAKAFTENDEMLNKYGKMMMPCKTYIEECVKLSWLMQIQTPPVCLDLKTAKKQAFPKDTYREFTSKGKHIAFVVWPALLLHDGGPLLAKGVAQGK
ncbi:hypothetical protein CHS0354_009696 [Potamilus streckersoni]|uniref:Mitochondria-eating protein n=1 Tax=Potamilus streckersoni TaxID=2493646 RepID=A0AAE0S0F7_9BIVA|nr:hypothetical protein CHS0354_009696 [Potamilus streckersoni]